jgi:hypothetical protein
MTPGVGGVPDRTGFELHLPAEFGGLISSPRQRAANRRARTKFRKG